MPVVGDDPGRPREASGGAQSAWLVYDGACPLCSRYVRFVRLREAVGDVQLVDARAGGPVVEEIRRAGLDLNAGMVLDFGGRYYAGPDCVHALALLSSRSGTLNRLNAVVFRSPTLARWLYPVLRAGRNALLRILRTEPLPGAVGPGSPDRPSDG